MRFDWSSDLPAALKLIQNGDIQLAIVSEELAQELSSELNPQDRSSSPLPPVILLTTRDGSSPFRELPPIFIGRAGISEFSEVLASGLWRSVIGHLRWERLFEYHRSFESLLAEVSTRFIQIPLSELDTAIEDAISLCARFCKVDRAFLMLLSEDHRSFSMSYEWCASGLPRAASWYQDQPVAPVIWAEKQLKAGEVLAFKSLADLPPEAQPIRALALSRGVQSVALVPLLISGKLLGALGFSNVRQGAELREDTISLLRILGEILANAVERRRTETAVRDTEERFRTLVESLGEGILFSDRNDVLLHVNTRMCELSGYTPSEMIGAQVEDLLLPPDEGYKIRERTQRRLQGISEAYSIRLMRKDGSRFWAEINAAPIRGADGSIVGTVGAVTDISDRKEAIEALQASERKYRDLVETSSDLIWSADANGRWTFVNQAAERIYGLQPVEMLGKPFTDFMRTEVAERDLVTFGQILDGTSVFQYETEHLRKDGSPIFLSFNAIVLRDPSGKIIGATGTATDITKRKIAEAALSKSEERFKRFFELPLIGVGVSSADRRWIDVNPRFCEMLGYKREELIGRSWMELTHPDDLPQNIGIVDRSQQGEFDQWSYDKRFIRKDGSILHVTTSGACVRKSDGSIDYFIALHQDITARKESEAETIRQRQFLREVIDSSPNVIFAKDLNGRYTLANRAMAEIFGTTLDKLIGRTDFELVSPELAKKYQEIDRRVLETASPIFLPEETAIDLRTKQQRVYQTFKKPLLGTNGEIESILGVAWDITDRKQSEEKTMRLQRQLLQSQKMEAIGQLAAGIAHDLNNALAAVVGHLQLLRLGPEDSDKAEHSIDTALMGCKRATSLIEQLLGFSRQGKYNITTVSLERIVRETIDFLRKVVGTNIEIITEISEQDHLVRGDPAQIQQVLTNLIINAKQAMPGGGRITFRFNTKAIEKPERLNPAARPGNYCVISVEDSGVGIPPENIDKVFEPFFTTKGQSQGTGLGLSTVYGVLQGHGGWVELESTLGRGSTFSLYFPESKGVALEVVNSKPKDAPACSGTVMLVDDEQVLVDLGQEFLRRAGFKAVGFTDALAALEWYQNHWGEVDLIILDMKMPGIDGEQAFGRLRDINPAAQIAMLSGYSQDGAAQELLSRGALRFFQKPLKYPDLVKWIAQTLSKSDAA